MLLLVFGLHHLYADLEPKLGYLSRIVAEYAGIVLGLNARIVEHVSCWLVGRAILT